MQFNKGDLCFYGQTGVCKIEDITEKEITRGVKRSYYELTPVYNPNNRVFAPLENGKVFMRNIITEQRARDFIKEVPELLKTEIPLLTEEEYKEILNSNTCEDLLRLSVAIYRKKQSARANKKKIGFTDEKYLRRAEELLFGELAVVLNVTPEEIPAILFAEAK